MRAMAVTTARLDVHECMLDEMLSVQGYVLCDRNQNVTYTASEILI